MDLVILLASKSNCPPLISELDFYLNHDQCRLLIKFGIEHLFDKLTRGLWK